MKKMSLVWLLVVLIFTGTAWEAVAGSLPSENDIADIHFQTAGGRDISKKEAIVIARKAVIDTYGMPENELNDARAVTEVYFSDARPAYKRWIVEFQIMRAGSKSYGERYYTAIMDSAGNLIADADFEYAILEATGAEALTWPLEVGTGELPPIIEIYCDYAEYEDSYLVREWPLETKAEYSQAIRSKVLEATQSGDLTPLINADNRFPSPNREIIASTTFAYGLPGDGDIPENDALDLARGWLEKKCGIDVATSKRDYSFYEYFDVTNPDVPLWKFIFFPDSFEGMGAVPVYRIELHAKTGELTKLEVNVWREIFEESAYNLKWY